VSGNLRFACSGDLLRKEKGERVSNSTSRIKPAFSGGLSAVLDLEFETRCWPPCETRIVSPFPPFATPPLCRLCGELRPTRTTGVFVRP
jgi:hypothetical protein